MGKVYCPSLFINLYAPALTPEDRAFLAFCHIMTCVVRKQCKANVSCLWGIIYVHVVHNVGYRTEPCCTLAHIYLGMNISPSMKTVNIRFKRNELISLITLVKNLYSKPRCHTVSKAFLIFKNTAAVDILLLKF
jgi:hypothetical protein